MKTTTEQIDTILNCENCYGKGYTGWVSPDGDYDFANVIRIKLLLRR